MNDEPTTVVNERAPDGATVATERRRGASAARRRGFLRTLLGTPMAIGFTALASAIGVWFLGIARFMIPNVMVEPPTRFKVGHPEDYPPGYVETRFKAKHGVWIVHGTYDGETQIYALRAVCTHLGCIPYWFESERKFKCPCHGSGFYQDGINFEGPAPRPLERCAIRVARDGQMEVDMSQTFQQELGEWTDPASFVRV